MNTCLEGQINAGIWIKTIERSGYCEIHLTLQPLPGETIETLVSRLVSVIRERDAKIVRHEVFGPIRMHLETMSAITLAYGKPDWPVTWVEGSHGRGSNVSGMHVFAISGTEIETIELGGEPIGRLFSAGSVRHCLLGDVKSPERSYSRERQCHQTFERIEQALSEAGMSLQNLMRTNFYLDDILSWYGQFNRIRGDFFKRQMLLPGSFPASTGVGGRNPSRTALVAGAWAVQSSDDSSVFAEVPSPLQCPAIAYGSTFSRAVVLNENGCRRLLVSGTASIAPDGRSIFRAEVEKQIGKTMEVVSAILTSQNFSLSEVTRATAYVKETDDISVFNRWANSCGQSLFPFIETQMEICRDELLFEIELDATSIET